MKNTKYDWRSIDCSKMPDYEVSNPDNPWYNFWYDDNFWSSPHYSDKFWSTSDCELIPEHCYLKFIKGFNISDYIVEASVKEYGTR